MAFFVIRLFADNGRGFLSDFSNERFKRGAVCENAIAALRLGAPPHFAVLFVGTT